MLAPRLFLVYPAPFFHAILHTCIRFSSIGSSPKADWVTPSRVPVHFSLPSCRGKKGRIKRRKERTKGEGETIGPALLPKKTVEWRKRRGMCIFAVVSIFFLFSLPFLCQFSLATGYFPFPLLYLQSKCMQLLFLSSCHWAIFQYSPAHPHPP